MTNQLSPVLTSAGYLLTKAGVLMSRRFDDVLEGVGLTGREFLVLTHVGSDDALSQQQLSQRLGLDPTIVVGLVDGLEGRSLVTRTRDVADRRRYVLALTASGRRLAARATAAAAKAEDELLAPLDRTQRSALRSMLVEIMRGNVPWLA